MTPWISYLILKRRERRLSQEKMAESIGMRRSTISYLENRSSAATFTTVVRMCRTLGLDIAKIAEMVPDRKEREAWKP